MPSHDSSCLLYGAYSIQPAAPFPEANLDSNGLGFFKDVGVNTLRLSGGENPPANRKMAMQDSQRLEASSSIRLHRWPWLTFWHATYLLCNCFASKDGVLQTLAFLSTQVEISCVLSRHTIAQYLQLHFKYSHVHPSARHAVKYTAVVLKGCKPDHVSYFRRRAQQACRQSGTMKRLAAHRLLGACDCRRVGQHHHPASQENPPGENSLDAGCKIGLPVDLALS